MSDAIIGRKRLGALLQQQELTPEQRDLMRKQAEAAPGSFTQHHIEICRRRFLSTEDAFFLDLIEALVRGIPSVVVSGADMDLDRIRTDANFMRLFELVLRTSCPQVPAEVQSWLLQNGREPLLRYVAELSPDLFEAVSLETCVAHIEQLAPERRHELVQKMMEAELSEEAIKFLADASESCKLCELLTVEQVCRTLEKKPGEASFGLCSNYLLSVSSDKAALQAEPLVQEIIQFTLAQIQTALKQPAEASSNLIQGATNLLCVLDQKEALRGLLGCLGGFQAAFVTAVSWFRAHLVPIATRLEEQKTPLDGQLRAELETDFKALASATELILKHPTKVLAEEMAYCLMEALSVEPLQELLKAHFNAIAALADYLCSFEDPEWNDDWASWCQAVRV